MIRVVKDICVLSLMMLVLSPLLAQEQGWTKTLSFENGLLTIYPPQVESMDAEVLHYRAALSWRKSPDEEPVFGAGWFESVVDVELADRVVHPRDVRVTAVRFPQGSDIDEQRLRLALAGQWSEWSPGFPLDQLEADLQAAAAERQSLHHLNTAPPQIIYRDHPALLVTLDGDPLLRDIDGSQCRAVINTPYPMISDGGHFYLNIAEDIWYRADQATGPYRYQPAPPAHIAALVNPDEIDYSALEPAEPITAAGAPEIIVTITPAELIVTNGPAVFVPLTGELLVLQNSEDSVFLDIQSQQFYIVLAGRWYHAGTLQGPWFYQAADQLPAAFAEIPKDSKHGEARVHVAGTAEADAAVLDAQLPQTNVVARGPADVQVAYDGKPAFQPVDGTELNYASNSGSAVLQSDRQYFLVEDGVWYVSSSPNGPWQVSAWRPESVSRILPSSPIYHVKYVYIYGSAPDFVYFGYTPGYFGSYVYHGSVVYGTGWYYRPWLSPHVYYPRPRTWGFHPRYIPWAGWSFSLSWNWGWDPFYPGHWTDGHSHRHHPWHHRQYSYWGPRGHRARPATHGEYHSRHGRIAESSQLRPHTASARRSVHSQDSPNRRNPGTDQRNRGAAPPVRDHADRGQQARRGTNAPRNEPRLRARLRNGSEDASHSLVVIEPGKKAFRKSRPPLQLQSTAQKLSRVNGQRNERPRPPASVVMAQQPAPLKAPSAARTEQQLNAVVGGFAGRATQRTPAPAAPPRRAKASEPVIPQPRYGGKPGTILQRGIAAKRQPRFEPSNDSSRRVSHKRGTQRQN